MATHHQHRTSVQTKKTPAAHVRPSKAASKRSVNQTPPKESGKSMPTRGEDEDVMAASFLQFCATCEKQIITPNNSMLYCSESCRRKDQNRVFTHTIDQSPPPTPYSQIAFEDLPVRNIVPQRSPTSVDKHRFSYSEDDDDDHTRLEDERRTRRDSEAARYLRQFASPDRSAERSNQPRPRYNRPLTSTTAISTAPSLSHTPNSTTSTSFPYTPSTRPLPPRTNPYSSSYAARSINLVMPFTSGTTTAPSSFAGHAHLQTEPTSESTPVIVEGEILYLKREMMPYSSSGQGSLRQLFRFDETQALPSSESGVTRQGRS